MRRLETMRRDFVANVSHELKTPLTAIKGFVETLLDGAVDDRENSRHFLEIVREHAGRLETLINDLLMLSYLESGKTQLESKPLDIKALADKVAAAFSSRIGRDHIVMLNNIP
jgi:two-component system phosphate regulon sensor histidine kinase PhoR